MNPELLQILLAAGGALAGYFLRHFRVSLPGVVIPPSSPAATPQAEPLPSPGMDNGLFQPGTIIAQLLLHQKELIRQLGIATGTNLSLPEETEPKKEAA